MLYYLGHASLALFLLNVVVPWAFWMPWPSCLKIDCAWAHSKLCYYQFHRGSWCTCVCTVIGEGTFLFGLCKLFLVPCWHREKYRCVLWGKYSELFTWFEHGSLLLLLLLCWSNDFLFSAHVSLGSLVGLGKVLSYGALRQVCPGSIVAAFDDLVPGLFDGEASACV